MLVAVHLKVDDVPDVVKSSLNNVDKIDQIDEDMIDREIVSTDIVGSLCQR